MKKILQTTTLLFLTQLTTAMCHGDVKIHLTTRLANVTLKQVTITQHREYPIHMGNVPLEAGKAISVAPEHYTVTVNCSVFKEEKRGRFTITTTPREITLQAEEVIPGDNLEIVEDGKENYYLKNNTVLKEKENHSP